MNNKLFQSTFEDIPLSYIECNPYHIRKDIPRMEVIEFSESIKEMGLLHPILVKRGGESYEVIAGERRYKAFLLLSEEYPDQYNKIPCQVVESKIHPTIFSLTENIQRVDLTALEESEAIYSLIEITRKTYKEIGTLIGKSEDFVEKRLRYLRIHENLKSRITAFHPDDIFIANFNRLSLSKVLMIKPLYTHFKPHECYEFLVKIIKEELSTRDIKRALNEYFEGESLKITLREAKPEEEAINYFEELGFDDMSVGKQAVGKSKSKASSIKLSVRKNIKKRLKLKYSDSFWSDLLKLIRDILKVTIYEVSSFQNSFKRLMTRYGESFLTT